MSKAGALLAARILAEFKDLNTIVERAVQGWKRVKTKNDDYYLHGDITEKMVKPVGFRNLIVHEYDKIDLGQVFEIAKNDIKDLNEYLKSIFRRLRLGE